MKIKILCLIAALSIMSALPAHLSAWGKDGHNIVALIAEDYVTTKTRDAVKNILGDETMVGVSTWADAVRREPAYKWTAPLHYVNLPENADKIDMARDCPDKKCVIGAIQDATLVLSDKNVDKKTKYESLKFLIHFVGDVHQPMHAGKAVDFGGNDVRVTFFENPSNLHKVWDNSILRYKFIQPEEYAKKLVDAQKKEKEYGWSKTPDPCEWALESSKIALTHCYNIPKSGELGKEYYDESIKITETQLLKGGIRLAETLNTIFSDVNDNSPKK